MDDVLDTFIDESEEHIESINNLLIELENAEFEDEALVDEILRELHSLKGSARMVGAEKIEEIVHGTETIIENIQAGKEDYEPALMDIFFEVVDDVQAAIDEMVTEEDYVEASHLSVLMDKLDLFIVDYDDDEEESDPTPEASIDYSEEELLEADYAEVQTLAKDLDIKANQSHEELVEEILSKNTIEEESESSESSEESAGEFEEPATRDSNKNEEDGAENGDQDYMHDVWDPGEFEGMVDDYLAEAKEMLNQLTNSLIELEQEKSPDKIDSIFRVAHTLKGSSGMIGLAVLEDLAHDMEELLDEVRDGNLEVTSELIDLLLMCNDKIEQILNKVEKLEPVQVKVKHLIEGIEQFEEEETVDTDALQEADESVEESETDAEQDEAGEDTGDEDDDTDRSGKVTESIRVNIDKLDNVINLVGELVINRGRMEQKIEQLQDLESELENMEELIAKGDSGDDLIEDVRDEVKLLRRAFNEVSSEVDRSSDDISRVVSDLQESVMRTRMVSVAQLFNKFPRLVRDLSRETGKEVNLEIEGKDTEMDKTVIEKISDPLMHIIRNSVDHGIESPEDRVAVGKPEEGTLKIEAGYEGDLVVIEIEDDGQGVRTDAVKETALERGVVSEADLEEMSTEEIQQLIFEPGFSTEDEVSETSGRGVGMDVVRSNIRDLNGSVEMNSVEGEGTHFVIKLPLTVAIIQVLLVRIGERRFAVPLSAVSETLRIQEGDIRKIGQQEVFELRGKTLSLLRLSDVLGFSSNGGKMGQDIYPIVVVQSGNEEVGILVDELLQKQEIVIKDLGSILNDVKFASGATIMGDGQVVLIVDVGEILQNAESLQSRSSGSPSSNTSASDQVQNQADTASEAGSKTKVLIAEDSDTQRKVIEESLKSAGYETVTAEHGEEALEIAREESFDFVSSDIRMPFMNGYELTESLRELDQYSSVPILLISSLDEKIDKMRGFDVGADDYLEKPFSDEELTQKVRGLLRSVG